VIANDALGNFVVSTPLLTALRARWQPTFLHYYGGVRTAQFERASTLIDGGFALFGSGLRMANPGSTYDLVINLESSPLAKAFAGLVSGPDTAMVGPALAERADLDFGDGDRADLWRDQDWTAPDLTQRFPFLTSGFIAEIFLRLSYLEGPLPRYAVPTAPIDEDLPDVLLATSASLPEKLWPFEKWSELLRRLNAENRSIGLLGAKPSGGKGGWKGEGLEDQLVSDGLASDLRGKYTLPQVAHAVSARPTVTLDNGILHLAAAGDQSVVGLFRYGIHRLWTPPVPPVVPVVARQGHPVSEISVEEVWEAIHVSR